MRKAVTQTLLLWLVATLALAQTPPQSKSPNNSTSPNNNDQEQVPAMQSPDPSPAETQSDQPALNDRPEPPARERDIPLGTKIRAVLDSPLSSRVSRVGDRFTATVVQPIRAVDGEVVVPAGSSIEGEVVGIEHGRLVPALRGKGHLVLRFRDFRLANGQAVPMTATLVSVHSTRGAPKVDEEGQVKAGTSGKDVAKDVGIGSGVGTVAGLIFFGPLRGLAIGAIVGGGYVLGAKGKDVELPSRTGLVLRVDRDLPVPEATPGG